MSLDETKAALRAEAKRLNGAPNDMVHNKLFSDIQRAFKLFLPHVIHCGNNGLFLSCDCL